MGKGIKKWLRQNNIAYKETKSCEVTPSKPIHISHPLQPEASIKLPPGGYQWKIKDNDSKNLDESQDLAPSPSKNSYNIGDQSRDSISKDSFDSRNQVCILCI